ncbi:MAG: L-2-hydroxyglutarate oxidase [Pseudomonadota bacterium]
MYDFAIVGGGIVGLSTGMALGKRFPRARILILEKENVWAKHQTGHNSGVIHSGIYYKPGSFKAKFAHAGNQSMVEFCREHDIEHDMCGKVIVATKPAEVPLLDKLYERGLQNELSISKIGSEQLKEIEPHVQGLCAIRVPSAGIVNYTQVCKTFARLIEERGGNLCLGTKVERIKEGVGCTEIETTTGTYLSKFLINCAGLQSDRVAKLNGAAADLKIVPFRGEYFELKPERRHLVKHLVYPVPNPDFPFLGVHYTRMIGGHVEAGPNAVLAFKREGYKKTDFHLGDFLEVMTYKGFWKLASKYWKEGAEEMIRSYSKAAFVRSLQQLIPEIQADDLIPAPAGIRAQALKRDGSLVDDFHIIEQKRSIHVCNAPSPAATASLEIGNYVANRVPAL